MNACNEAALAAAREGAESITMAHFEKVHGPDFFGGGGGWGHFNISDPLTPDPKSQSHF